ncbi:MAG: efflux RND transporter permease subunit [Candidatus Eremiobacteraeota bacterium]|nr:efflux RND transporter permease subunit [Candidatus Eremiobacteraeota bacterium]
MNISEFSVRRPVAITMFFLIVMLLGVMAFTKLKIDYFPDMTFPLIAVFTAYPGAGPVEVENEITRKIEEGVSTVRHLKHVRSTSKENLSVVMVEFEWGVNMDYAAQEVRDKIDPVIEDLPDDAKRPTLLKFDPNVVLPFLMITVEGPQNMRDLKYLTDTIVKKQLEKINGVGAVSSMGGLTREILVEVDENKLRSYHIPVQEVSRALKAENIRLTGGRLDEGESELQIRTQGEFRNPEEIENIAVAIRNGQAIRMRDVARVLDTTKDARNRIRMDGKEIVACQMTKQSVANTVEVAERVRKAIPEIEKMLPAGTKLEIAFDQSRFIRYAIDNTQAVAVEGGLLAVLIIFLFLSSGRSTIIIAISIPISIIATFVLMHFKGMTINVITLGGLTLGIGRIVDDSIVVLENIHRHIERGLPPMKAAIEGAREVGLAVMASTFTTIAVFVPILYAGGLAQQLFSPMAMSISFALFASLAVALTLIPMMSSRLMKHGLIETNLTMMPSLSELENAEAKQQETTKGFTRIIDLWQGLFRRIEALYRRMLYWCLSHRPAVLALAAISLIAGFILQSMVGIEFVKNEDQSQVIIMTECPPGTALHVMDRKMKRIYDEARTYPEARRVMGLSGEDEVALGKMMSKGSRTGTLFMILKPPGERKKSQAELEDQMRKLLATIPGLKAKVMQISTAQQGGGADLELKIFGNDLETLSRLAEELKAKFGKVPGVTQADLSWEAGNPEYQIMLDREKAGAYGIPVAQVASTVRTLVKGEDVTKYREKGEEFDITVRARKSDRRWVESVEETELLSPTGAIVPLKEIASVVKSRGPSELTREDRQRNISVTAGKTSRPLGDITRDLKKILSGTIFPPGYTWKFGGQEEQLQEAFLSLAMALIAGILLIYFILAAQFESLVHPFTIMLAIPLEVVGVFLALFITREPFSVSAFLGVLMLTGIVVSNSILLVNYINILRERGIARRQAILEAGPVRLRPILMTAIATVFAMIPMAMAIREGSETFRPLAIAVIGGLLASTFLTLLVVPVAYSLVDDIGIKLGLIKKGADGNAQ